MKKTTKKAFNVALASAMAAGAVVAVAPQASAATSFPDVPATHGHYADIMKLVEGGHINGFEDGTYRPNVAVTRGQAAKIIANVLGLDTTNVKDVSFKDLAKNNIYYGPIAALVEAGVINGFEDNTYRPNDTLTRGQMAKIIAYAFELEANDTANPFKDAEKSIYKDAIVALFANGVTTGKTATSFAPADAVTRGQLASFVIRANDVYTSGKTVVENKVTIKGIENGKVIVAGEELAVAPKLAAVFSDKNAAALKDAELTLVVEYTTEEVASVNPIAATVSGKIIGIKKAKFVAEGTTFDGAGVEIPLVETAKGMTLANVVAEELTVAGNVVFSNVEAGTVTVTGDAKITVDGDTTIEKVIVPAGKTLADVIANYNDVKDQLSGVKVETAPTTGGGGSTGGSTGGGSTGGGGGSTTATTLDNAVEKAVGLLIGNDYATFTFNAASNQINVNINSGSVGKPISEIRNELKAAANEGNLTYTSLLDKFTVDEAAALVTAATNFTVTAGKHTLTEVKISDYMVPGQPFNLDRTKLVNAIDTFIDDAIKATSPGANKLGTVGEAFADNISFTTAKGETYTVKITVPKN